MRFRFIDAERAGLAMPIFRLCRLLQVSVSGFYAWRNRGPSQRQLDDMALLAHVRAAFRRSRESYGAERVHHELAENGIEVGRHRVARVASSLATISPWPTAIPTPPERSARPLQATAVRPTVPFGQHRIVFPGAASRTSADPPPSSRRLRFPVTGRPAPGSLAGDSGQSGRTSPPPAIDRDLQ